jgi:hypothetical protein
MLTGDEEFAAMDFSGKRRLYLTPLPWWVKAARKFLQKTFIQSLATEENIHNPDTHNMLLYGICTLAYDETTAMSRCVPRDSNF